MKAVCRLLLFAPAVVARLSDCDMVLAVRICMREYAPKLTQFFYPEEKGNIGVIIGLGALGLGYTGNVIGSLYSG
jgi:hypothetical protein